MSLTAFQNALAQLIIDAKIGDHVRVDSESALNSFHLTAIEQRRLVAIAHDRNLHVAQRIHRFFRINALLQSLPLTVRLLGDRRLRSLAQHFWQLGAPRNYYYQREATRFGEFLAYSVESGSLREPYVLDVVRFELAVLDLVNDRQMEEDCVSVESEMDSRHWYPSLKRHFRLAVFKYAPSELLGCLESGEVPKNINAGRHYLLLDGSNLLSIRLVPLLPELGEILDICNGSRSAEEVATKSKISITDIQRIATAGYLKKN